MDRERPELAPSLRSATFDGYVLVFRYIEDRFEGINIVEGLQDMARYFSK